MNVQLHDGTVLEFPDGTPDDVIDAVAQQHAQEGMKPDNMAVMGEQVGQLIEALYQTLAGQQQSTAALIQSIQEQAQASQAATMAAIQEITGRLETLSAAFMAPKTIIKDDMGRPIGVQTMAETVLST